MISFISVCDVSNKIKKDNMMSDNNEAAFVKIALLLYQQ